MASSALFVGCGTEGPVYSGPVVAGGAVYVGSQAGVYALSTADGRVLWTYDPYSVIDLSPAVADGGGYVAAQNQTVYALSATASS